MFPKTVLFTLTLMAFTAFTLHSFVMAAPIQELSVRDSLGDITGSGCNMDNYVNGKKVPSSGSCGSSSSSSHHHSSTSTSSSSTASPTPTSDDSSSGSSSSGSFDFSGSGSDFSLDDFSGSGSDDFKNFLASSGSSSSSSAKSTSTSDSSTSGSGASVSVPKYPFILTSAAGLMAGLAILG